MLQHLLHGAAAGAVGTLALDTSTYLDMALRGRAPSSMTQTVVQKIAGRVGLDALAATEPDEATKNRQSAVGALMGYATGVGAGMLFGAVRPALRARIPVAAAGLAVGLGVMATTDGTATWLGATDPREWSPTSWMADLVPHAIFGLVTALAYDAFVVE